MSGRILRTGKVALAAAIGLLSAPAPAGTFAISPLRIDLSTKVVTAAITVRNQDDAPVVIQAESMSWSQPGSEDRLEPTRDVLVSPAVFTLPSHGSQLIRVALRRPVDSTHELTYRLILTEVPQPDASDETGLRIALRLSLPVFVTSSADQAPDIAWTARRDDEGKLVVSASNSGNAHFRVLGFSVDGSPGDGTSLEQPVATYVLPGATRKWVLDSRQDDGTTAAWNRLHLKGLTEHGDLVADFPVDGW
jgi:fimbrial chaperone protein